MEALFDVFQAAPIDTAEDTTIEEEVKPSPKKRKLNKEHVLKQTRGIIDNTIGVSYDETVCQYNDYLLPLYKDCLQLSYEPYAYQKMGGVAIDTLFGLSNDVLVSNILVSSPTGSGKTFLIKHAAKRAAENDLRLIIGVPLVALAEQTFSELRELLKGFRKPNDAEYSPVGIRTGPSEMFPDAKIMVCTYEIIAINLALSVEFLDDCPVVILDEIHFMTDRDRGARVEYIASSLPDGTGLVGLSGTIPNAVEFAHSMSRATNKLTRLIGLDKRPISLRYYCALGGEKFTEVVHPGNGDIGTRFKEKAWAYVCRKVKKRPDRLNYNQTRGRILQLVKDLQHQEKLPAMIVSFSCKQLNTLGNNLNSVDLIESHNQKSYIHQQFQEIRKKVGEEEWGLFQPLVDLAKKGIGIHHSQNPKLYLEVLPKLVKRGLMPVVLATSSLSTGIDLPVRSVVLLSLMQPQKGGFAPVKASLLQQIFGRAGRPGQEAEGNAILAMWTKLDPRVDVPSLLAAPSMPVKGNGMVQPREILTNKIHNNTVEDLLLSPFSSRDTSHITPVINDLQEIIDGETVDTSLLTAVEQLQAIRYETQRAWRYIDNMTARAKKGDVVVVDPDQELNPVRWTIIGVRPLRVKEFQETVPNSWVFDCVPDRSKKTRIEDREPMQRAREQLRALQVSQLPVDAFKLSAVQQVCRMRQQLRQLKEMVSVQSHPLYTTYVNITAKLKDFGFIDTNGIVSYKGRMVPGILGCEDVLCLVEAWTNNLLPRDNESDFARALTCFLQNHRHNQPADHTGLYAKLCTLQKHIGDENALGTNQMEPMRLWTEGQHSIYEICQQCPYTSPGHLCKTIQRLNQLLEQLQEAAGRTNDTVLEDLCDRTIRKTKRGLPFVLSMYLK